MDADFLELIGGSVVILLWNIRLKRKENYFCGGECFAMALMTKLTLTLTDEEVSLSVSIS